MPLSSSRIPLGRAHMLASVVRREAYCARLPLDSLTPTGSLRRFSPDIGDVALLAVAPRERHQEVMDGFAELPGLIAVIQRASASLTVAGERGYLTLHVVPPEDAGSALVWHTGSRRHTQALQARARARGLVFTDGHLTASGGTTVDVPSEEVFYEQLGLPFIPPELREDGSEVACAERGALPALVTGRDIRGDLHMHSTWSDGRDTIEEMVFAAQRLGYQYVAITDHSERSLASRRLTGGAIARQRREIQKLRARIQGIEVLHGIEVDIMQDGSLDFDDEQLTGFDIVLASLHDHGGHDADTLTARYLRAIAHPLVNVITHPANRAPGRFTGYELDYDRLFAAAAATGTAMEIDGAPGHLDMDGVLARRAVALGVTVAIDSDCHRADALARQMDFGLGTARRGWVEAPSVLNARGIEHVREFVARKRARL